MLKQINDNVNLLDYAGQTMELKQRGKDFFTNCPLHTDKTPSLSFNPSSNYYHCFSCGASGGIIKFLMDFESLNFADAVEKAAKLANVNLSQMCQSQTIAFLRAIRKSKTVNPTKYKHKILSIQELDKYKKEPIREWLDEGIQSEVMNIFGVRADGWNNRIIYPVYDIKNNLINIKARTRYKNYKAMKIPKYINYYPVGVMDYFQGLNITLPYIKEKNEVIIFESIKSVMKAYGWGYKNCVSAEKHTLTKEQLGLLVELKVNVVFAYDSDISYRQGDVRQDIDKLKRITNVFIIEDNAQLLGGIEAKNAPVDLGLKIWKELYENRRKVV